MLPPSPPAELDADIVSGRRDASLADHESLAAEVPISYEAIAGNSWRENTFIVSGDVIVGSGGRRKIVPFVDLTGSVDAPPHAFVRPPRFAELVAAFHRHRIVVLVGHGVGKSTAASNAMLHSGATQILQLPGDIPVSNLLEGIEQICSKEPATGILIDAVDIDTLGRLGGFELTRLRSTLGTAGGLIMTTQARATAVPGLVVF